MALAKQGWLNRITEIFGLRRLESASAPPPRRPAVGIERLEDRHVPAAITTLLIENTQPFDRVSEPVTSGVPLPASLDLTSPNRLQILDASGRSVPAQFRVLGRWGGGTTDATRPIRWLEVHFAADVPAGTTAAYTLDDAGTGPISDRISTTVSSDRVTISTGPARFEIDRNRFDLFRTVWLDVNGDGSFVDTERIITPTATAGAFVGYGGVEFLGNRQTPRSVILEESGPLRAIVRAEGFHFAGESQLLRFVTRMTFNAGQSHVDVHHTIIEGRQSGSGNGGLEDQVSTTIDRAGLRLNLNLGGPATARLRGDQEQVHVGRLSAGKTAMISQDRVTDWGAPMAYRGSIGDTTVEIGQRAARAWIGVGDDRWGVAIGTRDFYRKNPQRLTVGGDASVLVEFPSEPYPIRQSMGLGENVIIAFHVGEATTAVTERIVEGFGKHRLFATTPGAWARESGALGDVPALLPARWAGADEFLQASAAASIDHATSGAAFGLMHYLDMPIDRFGRSPNPDDTAWGNSYWDPAASLAAQFARTGDGRLLELLLFPMARHFYTTDMYDPDDANSFTNGIGGARGIAHRGAWTGEYHYMESLWDYYSMTGDRRALERGRAAAFTYAFHPQWAVTADQGGFETTTRALGQKFNTMMEAWLATGDDSLKNALDAQVRQYLSRRFTAEGFATAGPVTDSSYHAEQAFMVLLGMHDTMYRYYRLTGDPNARAFVVTIPERISRYYRVGQESGGSDSMLFHTNILVHRTAAGGFTVTRTTPNGNSDDFFYAESYVGLATALARAWQVSGNTVLRTRAEELLDFIIPRLSPTLLDKPTAMVGRRLLAGLAILTQNASPTISLTNGRIEENRAAGALVGELRATARDAGDRITLSLPVGRSDNAAFYLDRDRLCTSVPFDYETRSQYEVVVRATDPDGVWLERSFAIEVSDVDESPVLGGSPSRVSIRRGGPPVPLAPSATAIDPEGGPLANFSLTVRLASGGTQRDRLRLRGGPSGLSLRGSSIRFGDDAIGTLVGGNGTRPLVITFNHRASRDALQAVLRSVSFQTTARPTTNPRRVARFALGNASGLVSNTLEVTIDVR